MQENKTRNSICYCRVQKNTMGCTFNATGKQSSACVCVSFWRSCHTKFLVSRNTNLNPKPDYCLGGQLGTWTSSPDLGQTSIILSFHPYLWFYASRFRPQEVSCVLPPKLKMVESQVDFIPLTDCLAPGSNEEFFALGVLQSDILLQDMRSKIYVSGRCHLSQFTICIKKTMTNFLEKGFAFVLAEQRLNFFFFLPILKCLSNHIKGIPFNFFFLIKVTKLRMLILFTISMK